MGRDEEPPTSSLISGVNIVKLIGLKRRHTLPQGPRCSGRKQFSLLLVVNVFINCLSDVNVSINCLTDEVVI